MSALLNLIGLAARINAPGNFLSAAIPLYVAYRSALVAAPLPTTAATAGALAAFGDALAQTSEMRSQAMLSRLSKSPSIGSAPSENRIPSITLGQTSSGLIHTAPKLGMPDALVSLQFPRVQARSGSKIVSMDCALVEAQRVQPIRKRRSLGFDWRRTLAFTVFGVAYTGCVQHKLFGIYQRHCTGRAIARLLCVAGIPKAVALAAAVQKTLVNQLCAIPLLYYPLFFSMTGAIRGHEPSQIIANARARFAPLMRRNLAFWLPVQLFQFVVVPVEMQVLYVCVAGLAWNAVLSAHALSAQKQR